MVGVIAVIAAVSASYDIYQVESISMVPTLQPGEYLLSSRPRAIQWFSGRVARGKVVVAEWPGAKSGTFVKRVVGMGGDRIRIENGTLFRNGKIIVEPYVSYSSPAAKAADNWPKISGLRDATVPANHVLLLGDNRSESLDGRLLGSVSDSSILGVVQWHVSIHHWNDRSSDSNLGSQRTR
jgi:signal peptidase I